MNFPQKLWMFLASTVVTFVTRVCPELDLQKSQPPSLPQPATYSIDNESHQPERLSSPSSPSSNDNESPESQLPWPAPNLKLQQESLLAAQQHLQWQNSVLTFCFSYALGVSPQFVGTDNHHQLPFSMVLLSFLVLLTFIYLGCSLYPLILHQNFTSIRESRLPPTCSSAFCHTLSIPFSVELKCTVWVAFLLSLLIVTIFAYLPLNTS